MKHRFTNGRGLNQLTKAASVGLLLVLSASLFAQDVPSGMVKQVIPPKVLGDELGRLQRQVHIMEDLPALSSILTVGAPRNSVYLVQYVPTRIIHLLRPTNNGLINTAEGTINILDLANPKVVKRSVPYQVDVDLHPMPPVPGVTETMPFHPWGVFNSGISSSYGIWIGISLDDKTSLDAFAETITIPDAWLPGVATAIQSLQKGPPGLALLQQPGLESLKTLQTGMALLAGNKVSLAQNYLTLMKDGDAYVRAYFTAALIKAAMRPHRLTQDKNPNWPPLLELLKSALATDPSPQTANAISIAIFDAMNDLNASSTLLPYPDVKEIVDILRQRTTPGDPQWSATNDLLDSCYHPYQITNKPIQ